MSVWVGWGRGWKAVYAHAQLRVCVCAVTQLVTVVQSSVPCISVESAEGAVSACEM